MFMVYEAEPDAERYAQHASSAGRCPAGRSATARFSGRRWASRFPYYAEWEFPTWTPRPRRVRRVHGHGEDAMEMGVPFHVHFATVE